MATHIDHYRVTVGPIRSHDVRCDVETISQALQKIVDNLCADTAYAQIDAVNEDGSYREILVLDLRGVYA